MKLNQPEFNVQL